MFSNFVIVLLLALVIIYLTKFMVDVNNDDDDDDEGFRVFNSNANIYESIDGIVPNKMLYFTPPNSAQPDIDYQDYLNEVSGYDAGTRGYNNLTYATDVAAGLDTN